MRPLSSISGLVLILCALSARAALAEGMVDVAAGASHTCAVTETGGVHCWGFNREGQLGDGTTVRRSVPAPVSGLTTRVVEIVAGWNHTCVLTEDGGVQCWGDNELGQLGDGTTTNRLTAVTVLGLAGGVAHIGSGDQFMCAVLKDGSARCWGNNFHGQLGDGTKTTRTTPTPVPGLTGIAQVAGGREHTCAVTATGAVWCWGDNVHGQLGDGTTNDSLSPVPVSGVDNGVATVDLGTSHTCALSTAGTVRCWGSNDDQQLGEDAVDERLVPGPVVALPGPASRLKAGNHGTCAVTAGAVRCWGWITLPRTAAPTLVPGLASGVANLAVGLGHRCAVLTAGSVRCWGRNDTGELGDGSTSQRALPVAIVGLGGDVAAASAAAQYTCAATPDGTYCWGGWFAGQGDGTTVERTALVRVHGLPAGGVTTLVSGAAHTCALTTEGAVYCWGYNYSGQLGDGTQNFRPTAAVVPTLTRGILALAAGSAHTCAVSAASTVLCWGENEFGQVGDDTTVDQLTPVPVLGVGGGVTVLAAGFNHSCAAKADGRTFCWGGNQYGQLGNGHTNRAEGAVEVVGLDGPVTSMSAGGLTFTDYICSGGVGSRFCDFIPRYPGHTCAVTVAGQVRCWGRNDSGQLGDGTRLDRSSPVAVTGLERVASVVAGADSTCSVTLDGALACWGRTASSDDGTLFTSSPVPVIAMPANVERVTVSPGNQRHVAHVCVVLRSGALRCWGNNRYGELAIAAPPVLSPGPEPVVGVMGVGPATRAYFAEGATGAFFDTRFAIVNPGAQNAHTWLQFQTADGAVLPTFLTVPPQSRRTVDLRDVFGSSTTEVSTVVTSTEPLVVDRTMTWGETTLGPYGGHAERSAPAPASTWYLAEGSTVNGFNLFYLLQNPNGVEVPVQVRYLRPHGAVLEKTYVLPPTSRTNIWVNHEEFGQQGRALAASDVSAAFASPDGQPIIVERAMYLDRPGQAFGIGHESAGVTRPATQWFLAEGATGPFFDLFVLVANPGDVPADIEVTYLLPDGTTMVKPYRVDATSRFNIWVDREGLALADTAVSISVRSTNDVPVVVERAMWWPGGSDQWHEAHNSPGATTTGTRWAVADGEVGGPGDVETYILIANASSTAGVVSVTLFFEDGASAERVFQVLSRSRFNVDVRAEFPGAADRRFGAAIVSLGDTPAELVVERAMYWDAPGQRWAAGTNALATRLP